MNEILWDSLLTSDLNVRYWHHLSVWYNTKNICLKSFTAFAVVGTVLSWFFKPNSIIIWKILSTFFAVIGLIFLFVDWGRWIERMYLLRKEWTQVKDEYEILWVSFKNNEKALSELRQDYKRIKDKEAVLAYVGSGIPDKEKLKNRCYEEVLSSRGLK